MPRRYVPDAGDLVWFNFTPQTGHEQAGHRPALVLSPAAYNSKTSLMICCLVTTQIKNYPFEVLIGGDPPSAVLADQVKSLDWRRRNAKPKGQVLQEQLAEVRQKYTRSSGNEVAAFHLRFLSVGSHRAGKNPECSCAEDRRTGNPQHEIVAVGNYGGHWYVQAS
jgi:mRNA interferase MazF